MISLLEYFINCLVKGYIAAVVGRFFFSSVSGLIFFTTYVEVLSDNLVAIWASLVYNMTYLVPEALLTIVLLMVPGVRNALARLKEMAEA